MKYENLHKAEVICKEIDNYNYLLIKTNTAGIRVRLEVASGFVHETKVTENDYEEESLAKDYFDKLKAIWKRRIVELTKELDKL